MAESRSMRNRGTRSIMRTREGGRPPVHEDAMIRLRRRACFPTLPLVALTLASLGVSSPAHAQDADPRPQRPDTTLRLPNTIAGEFTPGAGFDIIKTSFGSLNISMYGLFRYLDQVPGNQTFTDHLGNVQTIEHVELPQLAPHAGVADRFLLRPEVPLQHHTLVPSDDAANTPFRQLAIHRFEIARHRCWPCPRARRQDR